MRIQTINSIDELLKHDEAYPEFTPVIFGRSPSRRFLDSMIEIGKRIAGALLFLAILAPVGYSSHGAAGYVARLESMRGESYSAETCSGFICAAKRHAECKAAAMWTGCGGDLTAVREFKNFAAIDRKSLLAGDVLDFGGVHVAVYVGHGEIMDSVPERGVGTVKEVNARDSWYAGTVKVLRWNR